MTINQYRRQYLRWQRTYERSAYLILRRAFIKTASNIPIENLTEENYIDVIRDSIDSREITKAYSDLYTKIGITHGDRVTRDIVKQQKSIFSDTYKRQVTQYLANYGGKRIQLVTSEFVEYIINQITEGLTDGQSISNIVNNILKRRSIYRWQLLRIARTESTASAGYASDVASSTSGIVMEKVWVSAQDSRTRIVPEDQFDHYHMNEVRVPDGEKFKIPSKEFGFVFMSFPADPQGDAGNVINCRCSMIKVVKRDENGNIVRRF